MATPASPNATLRPRRDAPPRPLRRARRPGRGRWRDYVAIFPDNGFLEKFGVEAAPGLDALLDQKVRRG